MTYTPVAVLEPKDPDSLDPAREMVKVAAHGVGRGDERMLAKWLFWHPGVDWVSIAAAVGMPVDVKERIESDLAAYSKRLESKYGAQWLEDLKARLKREASR